MEILNSTRSPPRLRRGPMVGQRIIPPIPARGVAARRQEQILQGRQRVEERDRRTVQVPFARRVQAAAQVQLRLSRRATVADLIVEDDAEVR